jgi:hypothetical protein
MIQGTGFRIQGAGFRILGAGFRIQGAGFRIQGLHAFGLGISNVTEVLGWTTSLDFSDIS